MHYLLFLLVAFFPFFLIWFGILFLFSGTWFGSTVSIFKCLSEFAIWNERHYLCNETKFLHVEMFFHSQQYRNIEQWIMMFRRDSHTKIQILFQQSNFGNPLLNSEYISINFLQQMVQKFESFYFSLRKTINVFLFYLMYL